MSMTKQETAVPQVDPVSFEIIRHRLFRIVEEAVITLKNVSGSPTTNEGHDLMVSLYTADGGLLMGGVGFLHHLSSASEACKAIIRRFGARVGEGDVYLLNDPYTAALHTSDVYLIAPIHYQGALVAWSACFVHVNDIGAMNPGGFCPDARDIFNEGFSSPGLRIVQGGEVCEDVLDTLFNMVRSPEMVGLDLRSMIACNHVAAERMRALLDRYGAALVSTVGTMLIAQSEQLLRRRLRELPDGSWHARQYMDVQGEPVVIELRMQKSADALVFDFTGSSPQLDRGVNCTRWAAWGGLLAPLYPTLCHDITWNEGVLRPVSMIAPEGTVVNCRRPAPVSIATVAAVQAVNNVSLQCISRMLAASPAHAAEATAVWHGSHLCLYLFGRNQRGEDVIGSTTETFAGSGGARWDRDGIDVGGEIPNPIARMANVETNEAMFPIRYLFRRRMRDSGGGGEFRGGTGGEYAIVPHDSADGTLGFVVSGKGVQFPMGHGLGGGYPGAPGRYVIARGGAKAERAPQSLDAIPGAHEVVSWGVCGLERDDVLYVRWNGAGGMGDPLRRAPEAVAADLREGVVGTAAARTVYGVALADDGGVDLAATQALRGARAPGKPRATLRPGTCGACGYTDAGAPAGGGFRSIERPLSELGAPYTTGPEAMLREMLCPACGAQADARVVRRGDSLPIDQLENAS
jgi:N-methylhydantoinase B